MYKRKNIKLDKNYTQPFGVTPGKYVKISVTDTGIGMDGETQKKIFDPFFTTKGKGRGTGMGLSSAYGIIKNHGGFITVNSKLGKSTTFAIHLPASKKKIKKEKPAKEDVLKKGTGTILLIDNEQMILNVGEKLLKLVGYNVLIAGDGKRGLEEYKKNQNDIDIVILDMIMPGMSGSKTYDGLKEINPDVKVLVSSGYSLESDARDMLKKGCSGFIQKPFAIAQLSNKISEILNRELKKEQKV